VVSSSNLGGGVQTLKTDGSLLAIPCDYINNVYQVYSNSVVQKIVSTSGIGTVFVNRVTTIVDSIDPDILNIGIYTSVYGNYSWGKIENLSDRTTPTEFKTYQNVSSGIGSNPVIQRYNKLKYERYTY
jgi:hypothetical protein